MTSHKMLLSRWSTVPGSEILKAIYSLPLLKGDRPLDSEVIYRCLNGLPFREQVPNGRDFRGLNFGGRELTLSDCDFSFCSIVYFYCCILDGSVFKHCKAERATFATSLLNCDFSHAKLRACYFNDSAIRNCNFSHARVKDSSFKNADLRGTSFTNADCRGAQFVNANIVECNFSGANLEGAVFADTVLDKSTNFRGANIANIYNSDWFDNQGVIVHRGTDLSQATI
jgi:uncharacterized protein YjbI with pentapeptide repeats